MSKIGATLLTAILLVTSPVVAADVPHRIARDAAWGCREKSDLFDLLFLGLSASFDNKLATAIGDGRCVFFEPGESVAIIEQAGHGIVRVQRDSTPTVYWTPARNVQ